MRTTASVHICAFGAIGLDTGKINQSHVLQTNVYDQIGKLRID